MEEVVHYHEKERWYSPVEKDDTGNPQRDKNAAWARGTCNIGVDAQEFILSIAKRKNDRKHTSNVLWT